MTVDLLSRYRTILSNEQSLKVEAHERYKEVIRTIEISTREQLDALEKECIQLHGNHVDDGGFLIGCCKHCGKVMSVP